MIKKCNACGENIRAFDDIVEASDKIFHVDCVELVPTGYLVILEGETIGDSENDEGEQALFYLDEGEYEDEEI